MVREHAHQAGLHVDILNPVQTAAAGMEPAVLKERFGDRVTFWGGGVDTQRTLPFGTPEEIRRQVSDRMRIFGKGEASCSRPSTTSRRVQSLFTSACVCAPDRQ
jgi:hypothetical protein